MFKFNKPFAALRNKTNLSNSVSKAMGVVRNGNVSGANVGVYKAGVLTCFQDNACSVPAGVDQPVGGVIDSSGWIGSELVVNGTFTTNSIGWTASNASITNSVSNGLLTLARNGGPTTTTDFAQTFSSVVGNVYKVSFVNTGSAVAMQVVNSNLGPQNVGTGTITKYVIAASSTITVNFWPTNDLKSAILANVSIKQVGSLLTQATSGYRPILRKGVVNICLQSNFVAGWDTSSNTTIQANNVADDFGNNTLATLTEVSGTSGKEVYSSAIAVPINIPLTLSVYMKAGTRRYVQLSVGVGANIFAVVVDTITMTIVSSGALGTSSYIASKITKLSGSVYRVVITGINASSSTYVAIDSITTPTVTTGAGFSVTSVGTETRIIGKVMLSVSSTESTYVATTTAPASNLIGNYWLDRSSDPVNCKLTSTLGATYANSTMVKGINSLGHLTLSSQNLTAATDWADDYLTSLIISSAALPANNVTMLEKFTDTLTDTPITGNQLVLRKLGTLFAPSVNTCFQDNACSVPSVVDGPVGGMIDASGWIGSEIVSDPNFNNLGWWLLTQPTSGSVSISNNLGTLISNDGSYAAFERSGSVTIGTNYKWNITVITITGTLQLQIGGSVVATITSPGTYTGYIPGALVTTTFVQIKRGSPGVAITATISTISVKTIGLTATQSTSGYRPILRKGAVNLAQYSENISVSPWLDFGNGATRTANTTEVLSTSNDNTANKFKAGAVVYGGLCRRIFTYTVGVRYNFQVKVKKGNWDYVGLRVADSLVSNTYPFINLSTGVTNNQGIAGVVFTATALNNGWYLLSLTHTSGVSLGNIDVAIVDSSGNSGFTPAGTEYVYIDETMLSISTITPNYVATTSAPASNGVGNYWLDFDGATQFLQLSSVPYDLTQDHYVASGAVCTTITDSCDVYSQTITGAGNLPELAFSTGVPGLYIAGGGTTISKFSGSANSNAMILSYKATALSVSVRKNGAVTDSSTLVGTYTVPTKATIGALNRTSVSNYMKGSIYSIAIAKATISDTEALLIEKYLASLTDGVTI